MARSLMALQGLKKSERRVKLALRSQAAGQPQNMAICRGTPLTLSTLAILAVKAGEVASKMRNIIRHSIKFIA